MPFTDDPTDPRLTHGIDKEPRPQSEAYLVLSEEERAKGFVRPYRDSYIHVGMPGPTYPLRDLTEEEFERYGDSYIKFEAYPEGKTTIGRFWTQEQLDNIEKGCGTVTTMAPALAETYSRNPSFYGATYCAYCKKHLSVEEFAWLGGTRVGS